MLYHEFEKRIRARFNLDVLSVNHRDGKHIANLMGGIRIIGNAVAPSIIVKWGSGHSAITTL